MKLLEKKLFNLPSEHVPAVIGEVLKAEYILVWAYHDSDDVRELAIRVNFSFFNFGPFQIVLLNLIKDLPKFLHRFWDLNSTVLSH